MESQDRLGLVPNTINLATGNWLQPEVAGIGAGIDSFYEYALKMYVMTGESEYYDVWREGYAQIMRYSRGPEGFGSIDRQLATVYIDSLSAFWPGLQVLAGDVENAIKSHLVYWNLWRRFSGIPETFSIASRSGITLGYPLRPGKHFATKDPFYLDVGERVLLDLIRRAKVDCGLSTLSNVQTVNMRIAWNHSRYRKLLNLLLGESLGLVQSIRSRPDSEYGRFITGLDASVVAPSDERWWDIYGRCEVPQAEEYVSTTVPQTQPQSPFDFDLDALAARLSELLGMGSSQPEQSFDYVLSIDGSVTEADKTWDRPRFTESRVDS
ncbi:glycoside hydrolase family 47 protein [Ceratobasidium sp. AG-Ba]|nr:glycoside hydrolase family 47 protein [Ceratobasidium sp. AG-Ba]